MIDYFNLTPGEAQARSDAIAAAGRDQERACQECEDICPLKVENGDPCDHEDMRSMMRRLFDAFVARHPHHKTLKQQLEDGGLDKRIKWMKNIGKLEAFDPLGHMRLLVEVRDALGKEQSNGIDKDV